MIGVFFDILKYCSKLMRKDAGMGKNMQNNSLNAGFVGGNLVYAPQQKKKKKKVIERITPASDTIGNDADARNQLNEMVKTLGDYRLKNNSQLNGKSVFPAIWKDLARHFKATSALKISINRKEEVFTYLQAKIDSTKQGRMNKGFRAKRVKENYK